MAFEPSFHKDTKGKKKIFGSIYRLFQRDSESDLLSSPVLRRSFPDLPKKGRSHKQPSKAPKNLFSTPPISAELSNRSLWFEYVAASRLNQRKRRGNSSRSSPRSSQMTTPSSPCSSTSTLTLPSEMNFTPDINARIGFPPPHACVFTAISRGIKVRDFALEEIEARRAAKAALLCQSSNVADEERADPVFASSSSSSDEHDSHGSKEESTDSKEPEEESLEKLLEGLEIH